jgi:putative transposase
VWIRDLPQGKIREIELIHDRKLMLCLSCDDGSEPEVNHHVFTASVDLGEIHATSEKREVVDGLDRPSPQKACC